MNTEEIANFSGWCAKNKSCNLFNNITVFIRVLTFFIVIVSLFLIFFVNWWWKSLVFSGSIHLITWWIQYRCIEVIFYPQYLKEQRD